MGLQIVMITKMYECSFFAVILDSQTITALTDGTADCNVHVYEIDYYSSNYDSSNYY